MNPLTTIRRMARLAALRYVLAGRFDPGRVLLLASSPRSGSTWAGKMFSAIPGSCVLFEPLQLTHVPEARAAGFSWRTYRPADANWPAGEAYLHRVFSGRAVNQWTSHEMRFKDARRATRLIVKSVRATRLLPWLHARFPELSTVLILRHPCAVVASQLRSEIDWKDPPRPDPPPFLEGLPRFAAALERADTVEERLAARWALDQLPPLLHPPPVPWSRVTYERLVLQPAATLRELFARLGLDRELDLDRALELHDRPSSMTYGSGISGLDGWKSQLDPDQVDRILGIVRALGITFYTDAVEPDLALLDDPSLGNRIREAGRP